MFPVGINVCLYVCMYLDLLSKTFINEKGVKDKNDCYLRHVRHKIIIIMHFTILDDNLTS